MRRAAVYWKEQFPQLATGKKIVFGFVAAICAIGCLALLAAVVLLLFVAAMLIIRPNIAPVGPMYMEVPSMYSDSLWVAEDDSLAFVADDASSCCGLRQGDDRILSVRIDFRSDTEPREVRIYATQYTQWTEDYEAYKTIDSLELLYSGVVHYIDMDHVKMELQGGEGNMDLCFERRMPLSDSNFEFEDEMMWPPEMLQWMEQRGLSK